MWNETKVYNKALELFIKTYYDETGFSLCEDCKEFDANICGNSEIKNPVECLKKFYIQKAKKELTKKELT